MKLKQLVMYFNRVITTIGLVFYIVISSLAELEGQTYGNLPMGGAGFVSGIITSKTEKDLIYLRTDVGGAYRWDNADKKWTPLTDWVSANETGYLGVESIAVDPGNPNNVYMSVGISYFNNGKSAILRSADKGASFSITDVTSLFKVHGNGMGRNSGEKLVVDPNLGSVLFCGSRSNGLLKSTDSAVSWSHVSSLNVTTTATGNGISFVVFDPTSGTSGSATQTLVVGVSRTGENLYRSDDGGATFYPISGAATALMPNRAVLASDSNLFITYTNAAGPWDISSGQIWKYKLSTGSWTNITPSGFSCGFGGISVDPNNAKRLVASTLNIYWTQGTSDGDRFFISNNGGASWIDVVARGFKYDPNGVTWNDFGKIHWAGSIEFDPFNTKRVFVVSGNGVFTTENIDSSTTVWKFNVKGLEETVPLDMVSIPGGPVISVVGDYDGCRYTDITKYAPQLRPSMGTTTGVAYAAMDIKTVVRAGSRFYYSSDTGSTWIQGTINGSKGYVSVSADGNTILHSPENSSTTYKSINKGSTWSSVSGINFNTRTVADPVNSSVFYAYNTNNGNLMVSIDKGNSFFVTGSVGTGGSKHIRTVPGYEGHLWVAMYYGGLKRSVNYGSTFSKINTVTACSGVGIGKTMPGALYPTVFIWGTVGGIEGLYFSTDQGSTWNRMNDNDHEWGGPGNGQFVIGDMNKPGLVYMSTAGRGIVYARPDYMLSSLSLIIPADSTVQITPSVFNGDTVNWTWSSGDTSVATVNAEGQVTGVSLGSSIITATTGKGKSVIIAVTVANPVTNILLSPAIDTINKGETVQLTATVSPSDATYNTVNWSSINSSIATVSSTGLVTGIKTGSTIITAIAEGNKRVSIPVFVASPVTAISVSPTIDSIDIGETMQLTATITPSDATNKSVNWSSSDTLVATVSSTGLVTGIKTGETIITAHAAGNIKASIPVIVGIPVTGISVSPTQDTIDILEKKQLVVIIAPSNATDQLIQWSSNNTSVATVDTNGLVTGITSGSAIITATSIEQELTASCEITVTSDTLTAIIYTPQQPDNISIYPNPLYGNLLNIDLFAYKGITTIRMLNENGQVVLEKAIYNEQKISLNISLKPGIYLTQFVYKQGVIVKKLIIY